MGPHQSPDRRHSASLFVPLQLGSPARKIFACQLVISASRDNGVHEMRRASGNPLIDRSDVKPDQWPPICKLTRPFDFGCRPRFGWLESDEEFCAFLETSPCAQVIRVHNVMPS